MSAPSAWVNVIMLLAILAVIPVWPLWSLMALLISEMSVRAATVAVTVIAAAFVPCKEKLTAPVDVNVCIVAVVLAVAVTPVVAD